MKKLFTGFALLLGLAASRPAQAQALAGTAWQGIANVPNPTEVVFQFKQDTLLLVEQASRRVIECMRYAQNGNQWTWYKLSGDSPCSEQTPGTYAYKIQQNELTITILKDDCPERTGALTSKPLKKITWPTP